MFEKDAEMHKTKILKDLYKQWQHKTACVKCYNKGSINTISELNMEEVSWVHPISWVDQERFHDEIDIWMVC